MLKIVGVNAEINTDPLTLPEILVSNSFLFASLLSAVCWRFISTLQHGCAAIPNEAD